MDYHSSRANLLIEPGETLIGKNIFDVMPKEAEQICMSALHEADQQMHKLMQAVEQSPNSIVVTDLVPISNTPTPPL